MEGREQGNACLKEMIGTPLADAQCSEEIPLIRTNSQFCRICRESESKGALVTVCQCKGTMGVVHLNCLEVWLDEKGIESCELCRFQYSTFKTPKYRLLPSFHVWLRSKQADKLNYQKRIALVAMFLTLFVSALIGIAICITYSGHLTNQWSYLIMYLGTTLSTGFCLISLVRILLAWCRWYRSSNITHVRPSCHVPLNDVTYADKHNTNSFA